MGPESQTPSRPTAADGARQLEQPQRGMQLLTIAFAISLVATIVGGGVRVFLLNGVLSQGESLQSAMVSIGALYSALSLVSLVSLALVLVGLDLIAKAPKDARVTELAKTALLLTGISIVLRILSNGLPYILRQGMTPMLMAQFMTGMGMLEAAIDLAAMIVLCESLLRLRRFVSPEDRDIESSEGLLRAAVIGAMLARLVTAYVAPVLGTLLGAGAIGAEWGSYLLRLPFSVALYGTLLWLVHATTRRIVA